MVLTVTVDPHGVVDTLVTDRETGEVYTLYLMEGVEGLFVGQVRTACRELLTDIRERCFEEKIFRSHGAEVLIDYVEKKYGDRLEFLWRKFSNNAIWRRADNRKWYGAVMTVPRCKLGLTGEGTLEVIDLRMSPPDVLRLVDHKTFFPAYHMNKKNWVTLRLDTVADIQELYRRLDDSYELAE